MGTLAFCADDSQYVLMGSQLWQRLRQARRYADLTQADMAQACGVSRGAVALWEAAEPEHRTKPTTDHLIAISKASGAHLEWLLNDASSVDALWRLTGEFGDRPGRAAPPEPAPQASPPSDVLPDLRQGEHLFVFAQTAEQIAAKLALLAAEPPTTKGHLVLVGAGAAVHTAATPADALAYVVRVLTQN